ncbi:MAG: dihydroorotate dehydrogenase [Actinobacteria bacterium]|nr:dihydroorotate dehydrogenase [Actinomycetota bacterium]
MGNIVLKNPVITCSGTFASGIEYSKFYDVSVLGAITTKSFSLERMAGNLPPRICETSSGMLNSIGLQNEGIDYFINEQLQEAKKLGVEIIPSIFGRDLDEFKKIAYKIKNIEEEIIAVELNLSCPNVAEGGIAFCASAEQVGNIVAATKEILHTGIIVKLSGHYNNISETASAAKKYGADAAAVINTIPATAFDIETCKPKLGNITGGLSGPAIKPVALLKVFELAKENIIPIIGIGGIMTWQDAIEFIIAGASAVGVGTANFIYPECGRDILQGIKQYMRRKNIGDIKMLKGIAISNIIKG